MNLIKYMLIAVIQGITEPLPISSSGHMRLFESVFNTSILDFNFEIVCNFGSFLAILFIFRKDVIKLIKDFFAFIFKKDKESKKGFMYCINIIISTIPVVFTGLIFKDLIDEKFASPMFLGFAFLLTSLALFIVRNINGKKSDYDLTIKDALIIGLFEAITIFPGISRSGTVLVACLIAGLDRNSALKYTFILYFPVSVGSMVLGAKDLIAAPNLGSLALPYLLGLLIAMIITYFSYEWMAEWVKKGKLAYFSLYCLFLATFIFIFFR